MIVVRGLLALIAATVVTRASVATNSDNFVISGPRRGTTASRVRRDRLPREHPGSGLAIGGKQAAHQDERS